MASAENAVILTLTLPEAKTLEEFLRYADLSDYPERERDYDVGAHERIHRALTGALDA